MKPYIMIWLFDSWFGGLQTLKYFKQLLPKYDYLFLADSKNAPYWEKSPQQIQQLTFDGISRLFDNWAKIVILACNTASAYAVRSWQSRYPEKKVLSVSIPWIEKAILSSHKKIGLIATQATIDSGIFEKKYLEISGKKWDFFCVAAPSLVRIVEDWISGTQVQKQINQYLSTLPNDLDALILWCTHFPILNDYFKELCSCEIIDPAYESVWAFQNYLEKHSNIKNTLSQNWTIKIYTSWDLARFGEIWKNIRWECFICWNIL